eukprot:TRINITY_DN21602_c0_g4_i3.p1 TRINITY_DN21602_c0_g4~~TRINITY_DN21602_c0_g4_i3.p1  ORF type:complete len:1284 (-),score=118.81 TRINITY_DN21602_c0_g4_i3:1663-5484(-)
MAECIGPLPGACPADQVIIPWQSWLQIHVAWPLAIQVVLSVTFLLVLHPLYVEAYYGRSSSFQRLVKTYIGTNDTWKVTRPQYLVSLFALQQVGSLAAVCIWVWHTYQRGTKPETQLALLVLGCIDILSWSAGCLRAGCDFRGLWRLDALVDMLTTAPVLLRFLCPSCAEEGYDDWLSLHFLRSYSALYNFERARKIAQLDEHTAGMTQVMVQLVLRIAALLTIMAGTTLTFEVLGDPWWLRDSFFVTQADDRVSFLQMVYWIVVSITTVGYGDFAPRTVITRVLTTVFIVVGVTCVYLIQFSFSEMRRAQHEGTGKYWQRTWGDQRHVVVILCHNGNASRMASLIHGFLQELLHASHNETEDHHDQASSVWSHLRLWLLGAPPAHRQTWPDVVFLSPTKWSEEQAQAGGVGETSSFKKFLEATEDFPSSMLQRIWFLVGSVTCETDLERARVRDSALTYVLSDLRSTTPDEDDAQTIYTAVVVRDLFPDVRLRLMVMRPESKELAVQAGIDATRCFSSRELSACMLAQNVRCRGLLPAVTAMFKSADADDEEFFLRQATKKYARCTTRNLSCGGVQIDRNPQVEECRSLEELERALRNSQTQWCPSKQAYERTDPWMFEYFEGASKCVVGFDLHRRFAGLTYGQLVIEVYRECGALLLGVQQNGRLILCPQSRNWKAKEGQICIAIARSSASVDCCRVDQSDRTSWRYDFQSARRRRRYRSQEQGRYVNAARLMGKRLQHSLLAHLHDPEELLAPKDDVGPLLQVPEEARHHADLAMLPTSPCVRPLDFEPPSPTSLGRTTHQQSPGDVVSVRNLRHGLNSWEDLVVLIVCHGEIWQQVRTFVASLRQEYLPCFQPVVVLAPTTPPPGLLEDCGDRVVCMQGSSLRAQALIEAGILEASTVVVFSGEVSKSSSSFDSRVVLTGQELECWLGSSPNVTFTAFELHDSASAIHLPRLRMKLASKDDAATCLAHACGLMRRQVSGNTEMSSPKRGRVGLADMLDEPQRALSGGSGADWDDSPSVFGDDEDDEREGPGIEDSGHRRRTVKEYLMSFCGNSVEEKSHDSIMFHPRFAAGQVFSPELWGMMLGRMFYMPAVIELIEALVLPSRREQVSYPWQIHIPSSYIDLPFSELLTALTLGASMEDQDNSGGTEDGGQPQRVTSNLFRFCSPAESEPTGPPAVPIALYRLRADFSSGAAGPLPEARNQEQQRITAQNVTDQSRSIAESLGGHYFVMLAPQHDTRIRDGDWAIVLGGKHFGRRMHEKGLLRGSGWK